MKTKLYQHKLYTYIYLSRFYLLVLVQYRICTSIQPGGPHSADTRTPAKSLTFLVGTWQLEIKNSDGPYFYTCQKIFSSKTPPKFQISRKRSSEFIFQAQGLAKP